MTKTHRSIASIILAGFVASGCSPVGNDIKVNENTHRHPAHGCSVAVTHTHIINSKIHSHPYRCAPGTTNNINLHSHS